MLIDDCLECKRGNYQVCSIQYCVQPTLCTVHTHMSWPNMRLFSFYRQSEVILCVVVYLCVIFSTFYIVFGRPFVKRFALCYRYVICLSCLSLTLVYIVAKRLDGSRWNLQAGRPRPRPHCVRWGPSSPAPNPPKGGGAPNFRPISVVAEWLDGSRCHLVGRYRPIVFETERAIDRKYANFSRKKKPQGLAVTVQA